MNLKIFNNINSIKNEIEYHNKKYHLEDSPEITDLEFDQLCKKYDKLIEKNPELQFLERKSVGARPSNQFDKYTHHKPMTSLNNAFSFSDVSEFIDKVYKFLSLKKEFLLEFICEPKIDGLSISLLYINGTLSNAVTRGDGEVGEIVTENIKTIKDIPYKLNDHFPQFIEIRGEIFMKKNNFDELNKIQKENGKKIFANSRNAAAGSIRQKDTKVLRQRKLNFFAFTTGEYSDDFNFETQSELLKKLNQMGFKTNTEKTKVNDINGIKNFYKRIIKLRNNLDYEIDGIVYKVNNSKLQNRLGNLSRAPRWAIAHKLPPEIVETIILDIDTQVGRTGALTPVGKLKPVRVGGVLVSNVTLHNEDEIARKDIRIGDTVKIQRAGDVIPQVVEVIKKKRSNNSISFTALEFCPSCNGKTFKPINEAIRRCISGINCPAQAVEKLKHFVSKNAFNIDGLGEKLIETLFKSKIINDFGDIFQIDRYKEELKNKEGFGQLSVSKLIESIESKKQVTLDRLIYSLGIRQIGEINAKLLAHHYNSFEYFCEEMGKAKNKNSASYHELVAIDQIGEIIADDIVSYFNSDLNLKIFNKLLKNITILNLKPKSINSPYTGKVIVLSGTLKSMSREEAKHTLQTLGAKFSGSVSKNTDFLIIGSEPGSKAKKAEELNIKIINEDQWIQIINNYKS